MKFKKLTLSLGSIAAVAAPISAVVSCGVDSQYSQSDLLAMSNLKSSEAHSKLQDLWLAKVLQKEYKMTETNSLEILKDITKTSSTDTSSDFIGDFKNTLIWVLKNKLFTSKDALSSIYQSLKSNAPDSLLDSTSDTGKIIESALNKKVFDRTQVDSSVDAVFANEAWKDIFYNFKEEKGEATFNPSILGVKDLVLKMMITKKYLAISGNDYKSALADDYSKVDSKYRDVTLVDQTKANFPLVVSVMNSRLAYKTSIELPTTKSREFIVSNIDNTITGSDLDNVFKATGKFTDKLTYTGKHQSIVGDILAKKPGYWKAPATGTSDTSIGFQGLSTLPTGDDNLNTGSASSIKLVKTADTRSGFIVTTKSGTKIVDADVRYTDLDKTKVELNYYTSLMPKFDDTDKTLEWDSSVDLDKLMNEAYTKDSSLYSSAIKYFVSDKNASPTLIEVSNDWARNYYVDEGLTYVDKEFNK